MADDASYRPGFQARQDGNAAVSTGYSLDIESGAALKIAGTDKTSALAAAVTAPVNGVAAGYKIARGVHTTVAAADTIVTGLATVVAVVATAQSDLTDDLTAVTATIGDQAGSPAAGSIIIKSWKNTSGTDPTPAAATSFSAVVNWIAIGT